MIWPAHADRLRLLKSAIDLARQTPPSILRGDGLLLVGDLIKRVPPDSLPCIFHSHATCQLTKEKRYELDAILDESGTRRDLIHVSLEWLDGEGPELFLTIYLKGRKTTRQLADCDHHGRWLHWHDDGG